MGLWSVIKSFFGGAVRRRQLPAYLKCLPEDELQNPDKTMMFHFQPPKEQYIIKNGNDYYVYSSKDDMPEYVREGVEAMESSDEAASSVRLIVDGTRTNYSSIEDIPDDIKKAIEGSQA